MCFVGPVSKIFMLSQNVQYCVEHLDDFFCNRLISEMRIVIISKTNLPGKEIIINMLGQVSKVL